MRRARTSLRLRLALLLSVLAMPATAADYPPRDAAQSNPAWLEKLEAIRGALVDAAIGKQARVRNVMWIDETGQLHENTHVTSEMRVRAIRVQHDNSKGISASNLAVEVMPIPAQRRDCRPVQTELRLPLIVETDFQRGGALVSNQITLGQIAKLLERLVLEQQSASARWETKADQRANSYTQWVSVGGLQSAPYRLKLTLSAQPVNVSSSSRFPLIEDALSLLDKPEPPPFIVSAVLTENASGRVHWRDSVELPGFVDAPRMTRPEPPAAWIDAVSHITANILNDAFHAVSCGAMFFDVTQSADKVFTVNAGKNTGVRTGDQMLIVTPGVSQKKILEKGNIEQTYIGEIREVFRDYSTIQIFGTSAPPGQATNLVAYPL